MIIKTRQTVSTGKSNVKSDLFAVKQRRFDMVLICTLRSSIGFGARGSLVWYYCVVSASLTFLESV